MLRIRPLALALALAVAPAAAGAAAADQQVVDRRAVAKPANLVAIPGYKMAHLSWDWPDNDDTTFRVFRADSARGPWKRIASQPTASLDLRGLPNGTTVWFAVASVLDGTQSRRTKAIGVTPNPTYPLGPGLDVVGYAYRGLPSRAYSVPAVSANGDRVVFAYEHLGWYDASTGRTKNLKLHSTEDLAMDDTGRYTVISHYYQGPGVTDPHYRTAFVDWTTKEVTSLDRHHGPSVVDLSADARYVAYTSPTSDETADAVVLDRTTGDTTSFSDLAGVDVPTFGPLRTEFVALSADGSTAALATTAEIDGETCFNGTCVAVWDLATGSVRSVPTAGTAQTVALNADGSMLATSGEHARVIELGADGAADEVVWQSDALHPGLGTGAVPRDYNDVALTRDASAVAFYTSEAVSGNRVGALHMRDVATGVTRTQVVPEATGLPTYRPYRSQSGDGAVFTADGRFLFSQQATRPGARPGDAPRRADIVRWEWATTTPDAG